MRVCDFGCNLSMYEQAWDFYLFFSLPLVQVSSPGKSLNLYPSNEYEVLPSGREAHWEVVERILFIYAKLNPGIAYVQGMNEIVGPIYYTFATDPNSQWKGQSQVSLFACFFMNKSPNRAVCDVWIGKLLRGWTGSQMVFLSRLEHAEADTFFCFTNLMSENRDNFIKSLDDSQCGITYKMESVYSMLKDKDLELYLKLVSELSVFICSYIKLCFDESFFFQIKFWKCEQSTTAVCMFSLIALKLWFWSNLEG